MLFDFLMTAQALTVTHCLMPIAVLMLILLCQAGPMYLKVIRKYLVKDARVKKVELLTLLVPHLLHEVVYEARRRGEQQRRLEAP